jgi:hypothetical protein
MAKILITTFLKVQRVDIAGHVLEDVLDKYMCMDGSNTETPIRQKPVAKHSQDYKHRQVAISRRRPNRRQSGRW